MNIHLHIERLVLDGVPVPPDQSPHLQAAIESELSRLLSAGAIAAEFQVGASLNLIRAGHIQLSSDSGPAEVGRQIAGAVHGGIAK